MSSRIFVLAALLAACDSNGGADAAIPGDGGSLDAGTLDGGSLDAGAGDDAGTDLDASAPGDAGPPRRGAVYVVLFTHIEDNTPAGVLGTDMARMSYLRLRAQLVAMAELAQRHSLPWVLQPDWKYLEAARLYEDATTTASTGGMSLFVYLRDVLGAVIDPHSHENGGYNYTDVAYLLEQLGVGGSTVIGGHIWDPALPQFQEWDRFRVAVAGERYPSASWRGDILIGAGTPGHVNDPLVSGVWRPRDRDRFFEDDPAGNIYAVGSWEGGVAGVEQLVALHADGTIPADQMLTASWNIGPSSLTAPDGIATIESTVIAPIAALRDEGAVVVTDFTSLVETWRTEHGARGTIYMP